MIGWNTIIDTVGTVLKVDNTHAEEVITNLTWQEEVIRMIEQAGIDPKKASRLARCESSWNPNAVHQNRSSTDYGLFQINNLHHPEVTQACSLNPLCATREFIRILKEKGWDEWSCNKLI